MDGSVALGSSKAAYVNVRLFVCCCSDNCHIATCPDSSPQKRRTKRDGESRRSTFDQPKQVGTKRTITWNFDGRNLFSALYDTLDDSV